MEHYSNFCTFEITSLLNVPGHYLRKYGSLCKTSDDLHWTSLDHFTPYFWNLFKKAQLVLYKADPVKSASWPQNHFLASGRNCY